MSGPRVAIDTARVITHPLRQWWMDVEIEGAEHIPDLGGAIIAANHLSFIDSMLLMYGLQRPVTFMGKVEYMESFATRHLFPAVGMIPVDRTGSGIRSSLQEARRRIDAGELLGIFPEGTRSRDGLLHEGHNGVAHLSLKTGAPIIPVGIRGTDAALPVGTRMPARSPIMIRVGAPIVRHANDSRVAGVRVRQELTSEVMNAIARLSGQARADRPTSSVAIRSAV